MNRQLAFQFTILLVACHDATLAPAGETPAETAAPPVQPTGAASCALLGAWTLELAPPPKDCEGDDLTSLLFRTVSSRTLDADRVELQPDVAEALEQLGSFSTFVLTAASARDSCSVDFEIGNDGLREIGAGYAVHLRVQGSRVQGAATYREQPTAGDPCTYDVDVTGSFRAGDRASAEPVVDGVEVRPVEPVPGRSYWAVYAYVGPPGPALDQAADGLRTRDLELGREFLVGEVACDDGASEALGVGSDVQRIGLYFTTEADALAFARTLGEPMRIVQITSRCGD